MLSPVLEEVQAQTKDLHPEFLSKGTWLLKKEAAIESVEKHWHEKLAHRWRRAALEACVVGVGAALAGTFLLPASVGLVPLATASFALAGAVYAISLRAKGKRYRARCRESSAAVRYDIALMNRLDGMQAEGLIAYPELMTALGPRPFSPAGYFVPTLNSLRNAQGLAPEADPAETLRFIEEKRQTEMTKLKKENEDHTLAVFGGAGLQAAGFTLTSMVITGLFSPAPFPLALNIFAGNVYFIAALVRRAARHIASFAQKENELKDRLLFVKGMGFLHRDGTILLPPGKSAKDFFSAKPPALAR